MRFTPPTVQQMWQYALEKNLELPKDQVLDCWEYFENADWRLSGGRGAKMKSWELALSRWARTYHSMNKNKTRCGGASRSAEMMDFDDPERVRARKILAARKPAVNPQQAIRTRRGPK